MIDSFSLNNIRIVLCNTSHPGNIGASARAMKTMGLNRLYLVGPAHFPDKAATARACGAQDILERAVVTETLKDALQGVTLVGGLTARTRTLSQPAFVLSEAVPNFVNQAGQDEVALIFGTEMSGLSNQEVEMCHFLIHIPANPVYSSLNLAAAVQVVCYAIATACSSSERPIQSRPLALFEDIERFYVHLQDVLVKVGFLSLEHPKMLMTRMRRLFGRAILEKQEVLMLRGMLRSIEVALKKSDHKKNQD
ncbi:MAG: RNA methyltransferase [Proteobacteria bacterium]|nr:RNA methyltransferase [Pseudomonadota bacterium]MDE3207962.1 RNA methyltransferase [Pseudomonadota bacterium]